MVQRVYLDYDQKALDDAYDQAVYAPNRDQVLARRERNSELARQHLGEPHRFAYGKGRNEQLDVFASKGSQIQVFIHGGAWRVGRAREYAAAAETFVHAGAHYVALDFDNTGDCGGDLFVMADQVRRAITWVHENAARFGGDPGRLYVSGASSGAHLGGVMATQLPQAMVKGYTLCSGMYDLRGPRLSKRSAYVKFTDEMEQALSPLRHLERIQAPIVVMYGTLETPEFQRQSRDFADALRKASKPFELIVAEGYNH